MIFYDNNVPLIYKLSCLLLYDRVKSIRNNQIRVPLADHLFNSLLYVTFFAKTRVTFFQKLSNRLEPTRLLLRRFVFRLHKP